MERQYIATTDKNFKEKHAFSPYDDKHTELLREFVALEVAAAVEPSVASVMDAIERRFYAESILIFAAHRLIIFDAVYDYLQVNDLWQELFVLPVQEEVPEAA